MVSSPQICSNCNKRNGPYTQFCNGCGYSLQIEQSPSRDLEEQHLDVDYSPSTPVYLQSHDVLIRFNLKALQGKFSKELQVPSGMKAVIVVDGKIQDVVETGKYTLESLYDRVLRGGLKTNTEIVLINMKKFDFQVDIVNAWTKDPLRINATCRLQLAVCDPEKFFLTCANGEHFTFNDLHSMIWDEVESACASYIVSHSVETLDKYLKRNSDITSDEIMSQLHVFMGEYGLSLKRICLHNVNSPQVSKLKEDQEKLYLGKKSLRNKKRLFDLYTEEELQTIAEIETTASHYESRAEVWSRISRALIKENIDDLSNSEQWEHFVHGIDKQKLLREDDLKKFRDSLMQQAEDRERVRTEAIARAQLEQEYNLKALEIHYRFETDQAQLENALYLERQRFESRLDIRVEKTRKQLEIQALESKHLRSEKKLNRSADHEATRESVLLQKDIRIIEAQADSEVSKLHVDSEIYQNQGDILLVSQIQQLQRKDREDRLRIQREHQQALLKLQNERRS